MANVRGRKRRAHTDEQAPPRTPPIPVLFEDLRTPISPYTVSPVLHALLPPSPFQQPRAHLNFAAVPIKNDFEYTRLSLRSNFPSSRTVLPSDLVAEAKLMRAKGAEKVRVAEEKAKVAQAQCSALEATIVDLKRQLAERAEFIETLKSDLDMNAEETFNYQNAAETQILALNTQIENQQARFVEVQELLAREREEKEALQREVGIAVDRTRASEELLARAREEAREGKERIATTIRNYKNERDAERDELIAKCQELETRIARLTEPREPPAPPPPPPHVEEPAPHAAAAVDPPPDFNYVAGPEVEEEHEAEGEEEEHVGCLWHTRYGDRPNVKACAGAVVDQFLHKQGAFKLCQQHTCVAKERGCRLVTRPTGRRCTACSRTDAGKERIKQYDSQRHKRAHY